MVIKTPAGPEVRRLVAQLAGENEVGREAAFARLIIVGARAVQALVEAAGDAAAPAEARAAAFRALEAIGDRRAFGPALASAAEAGTDLAVAVAAIGVVRARLASRVPDEADRAFEQLAGLALDAGRPDEVRLAAIAGLDEMKGDVGDRIRTRLAGDPSPAVRALAAGPAVAAPATGASIAQALDDGLDSPAAVRALVTAQGGSTPLTTLHRLVGAIRDREEAARGAQRADWLVARAAVHQTLAARRSKVALYDLRETLDGAREPLPVGFLAALTSIGDPSCLEPLAAAYARSRGPREDWWRAHLAAAFRHIVRRERLTRRHAAVKRALARWPSAAGALLPARRDAL